MPLERQPPNAAICVDRASATAGRAKVALDSALDQRRHGFRTLQVDAAAPSTSGTPVSR
jgi:hypothetical protein